MDVRMIKAESILTNDFIKLDKSTPLSKFIGELYKTRQNFGVIFDGERYLGVVEGGAIFKSKIAPHIAKIGNFLSHPPVISKDTNLIKIAELLYHTHPAVLPVMEGDTLLGVVQARDLIRLVASIKELANLKISSVMTSDLTVVSENERLGNALNIMRENHLGRLPVVDKRKKLIGVISYLDILKKYLIWPQKTIRGYSAYGRGTEMRMFVGDKLFALDTYVVDEADLTPFEVKPTDTVSVVVDRMLRNNWYSVLVTEKDIPIGVATTKDFLRLFFRYREPEYWNVHFVGLADLKPGYSDAVQKLVFERYEKIKRAFMHTILEMIVHIKRYEEKQMGAHPAEMGKTKYYLDVRLTTPDLMFQAKDTHWDLMTAVAWVMDKLEREAAKAKWRLTDSVRGKRTFKGQSGGRRGIFRRQQETAARERASLE